MAFYGKRRNYRKKRAGSTKKRLYKRRAARRVSTAVKSYVNKTIHKNIENKKTQVMYENQIVCSYANNTSLLVVSMIPYAFIPQGVGQSNRTGNLIKTRKCLFKYVLYPAPYSVTNTTPIPHEVIIMFGKVRNSKAQAPISTDFAKLYQNNDTYRAPLSRISDVISIVNKDWFQVYKVLNHKVGYSINENSGLNVAAAGYANNDFHLNVKRSIDLTKYCPKNVLFNDTTTQPTNDGLWMWAMAVAADGTASTSLNPIFMTYELVYEYEDA